MPPTVVFIGPFLLLTHSGKWLIKPVQKTTWHSRNQKTRTHGTTNHRITARVQMYGIQENPPHEPSVLPPQKWRMAIILDLRIHPPIGAQPPASVDLNGYLATSWSAPILPGHPNLAIFDRFRADRSPSRGRLWSIVALVLF